MRCQHGDVEWKRRNETSCPTGYWEATQLQLSRGMFQHGVTGCATMKTWCLLHRYWLRCVRLSKNPSGQQHWELEYNSKLFFLPLSNLVGFVVPSTRELSISGFTASQETTFGPFAFGLQKDSGFGCCKDGYFGIQIRLGPRLIKGTLWSVLGMNAMGMSHNLPPWEDAVAWKWYFTHLKSPQGFWVTWSNFSW